MSCIYMYVHTCTIFIHVRAFRKQKFILQVLFTVETIIYYNFANSTALYCSNIQIVL